MEQQGLDMQYQDFLARQGYPQQALGFYSNIIRGVPAGQTTTTATTQPSGSTAGQIAGILGGLGSLYSAFR
jgi:CRISPR/Cas system-associated protein endoribonuclease Cas2